MSLYLDHTTGESSIDEEPITQADLDAKIAELIERDRPLPGEMLDYFPEVVDRGMKLAPMFRMAATIALRDRTPANLQAVGEFAIQCMRAAMGAEAEDAIREEE